MAVSPSVQISPTGATARGKPGTPAEHGDASIGIGHVSRYIQCAGENWG